MSLSFERVEVRGLVKLYGLTRALAGIDVDFDSRSITVIEGPNGSGKSTLLTILAQLAAPTDGEIRYGPHSTSSPVIRGAIGVVGHAAMLYADLTGRENLSFFARLYAIPNPEARIQELSERFEIGSYIDRPASTWSRGQLQRVALARALLHRPQLLLLDEPSTGLDPATIDHLVATVHDERARGAIVVVVTHDEGFASHIADRRVRLERGRIAA